MQRLRPDFQGSDFRGSTPGTMDIDETCICLYGCAHIMKHPEDHPRRILLAVTGLSPQIVTETVYALALAVAPSPRRRFVPTEVQLITTKEGAERAKLSLLHPQSGWFHRLCTDYALPPIAFEPEHIHVLEDAAGEPLDDIRTPDDNTRAADAITEVVRGLTRDDDSALHVSIAGGRKTMGFYLGYALSLYGREQDRLSHVLVSPPYESHLEFYYPPPKSMLIHTSGRNGRPYDARDADVTLAEIPFVRLREGLNPGLVEGTASFSEAVAEAQRAIGPLELVIDRSTRRIRAGGRIVALSPVELAFLAWLAQRRVRGEEWVGCPSEGAPEMSYAEAFLAEYRMIIGEMGDDERTAKRLRCGMTREFFSQTKAKLLRRLRTGLGLRQARPYLIYDNGSRLRRRYGLDIASGTIRFGSVDPENTPAGRVATLPRGQSGQPAR